ncbi:hypothetical protein CSUB01_11821 [Colletotrichum sublineola]|uniref:Uncharacterized protein n=1 Tax=Colletotrichum sublineola TaxID=1173701 RepID=A0A066XWI8_COLSU|nr:hypothetical protein CSUB01_11821 [Colletotrichum sublineola]
MTDTNGDDDGIANEAFRRLRNLKARGVLNDRLTKSATSKASSTSPAGQAPRDINNNNNNSNRGGAAQSASDTAPKTTAPKTKAPKTTAPPQTRKRSRNSPGTNGAWSWTRTTVGMLGCLWSDVCQGAVLTWRLFSGAVGAVFRAVWWLLKIVLCAAQAFFLS